MGEARFESGHLDLEWSGVQGLPALGGYQLLITGTAKAAGFPAGAAALLQGGLGLDAPGTTALGSLQPLTLVLGYPVYQVAGRGPERIQAQPLKLVTDLAPSHLEALEQARAGGDLDFIIDLVVTLLHTQPSEHPQITLQDRLHVDRGQWVKVLEAWQRAFALPVIVSLPSSGRDSLRHRAAQHLQVARRALDDGRPRDAVSEIRHVASLIRQLSPAQGELPPKRDRNKAERFRAMTDALLDLTNAAHHVDDPATAVMIWHRSDAVAAIAIAVGLLQQLEA